MIASTWPDVSCSANDGMMREKPRPWPPSMIVAFQSTSSSGVVPAQSVKSGKVAGRSNIVFVGGAPSPFGPWQPAQPAWYSASPESGLGPTGFAEFCPADAGAATARSEQPRMKSRKTNDRIVVEDPPAVNIDSLEYH